MSLRDYTQTDRVVLMRGNDLRMRFPIYDQSGELVDISDATELNYAIYHMKNKDIIYSDDQDGGVSIGGGNKELVVDLTSSSTENFETGNCRHEAWITTEQGEVYTVVRGQLMIVDTLIGEE